MPDSVSGRSVPAWAVPVTRPSTGKEPAITPKRLSRQESREQTRDLLLEAAAELFAERGLNGTSVEQITERAGYTRGAFYGNFEDKHELVLALLEERTKRELEEIRDLGLRAGSFAGMVEQFRAWHRDRARHQGDWLALRTEMWLYARRNPDLLPVLRERELKARSVIAGALADDFRARGVTPPVPVELLALIVHSLDDGLGVQRVLVADGADDDVVVDVVDLLMRSWTALAVHEQNETAQKGSST